MKKRTRLLSLLLAFSLLVTSVFVTNVFAIEGGEEQTPDTTNPEVTVGSYTAPAGSWTPTSADTVYFAVWETEDAYLAGEEPVKTSLVNEITEEYVGGTDDDVKSFYVVLFADCTTKTTGQLVTGKNHTVVINLAGKTLDVPKGVRIGNKNATFTTAKFTLKNGIVNHTGGQMQTRQQSELRYDNVVYNFSGAYTCAAYDESAKVIEYKDSIVNVARGTSIFELYIVNNPSYTNELRFINTDIIQTVEATGHLISISTSIGKDAENVYKIFFDKDSTIVRTGNAPLVALNSANPDRTTAFPVFKVNQQLVFEAGFAIPENVIIDEYVYSYHNRSTGATLYEQKTVPTAAGYSKLDLIVVDGEGNAVEYFTTAADGKVTYSAIPSEEDAWKPETDTSGVDYTGITYGVWASELDYLLGKAPVTFSTNSKLDTSVFASQNKYGSTFTDPTFIPGFVRVFANVSSHSIKQIFVGNTQNLTIDLGGYTFTDAKGILLPGSDSSLTIKNGKWVITKGSLQTSSDSKIVFENLEIESSLAATSTFMTLSSDYVRFTGCTVTSVNGGALFALSAAKADVGSARSSFILEDTDIVFATAPTQSVFVITEGSSANALWDISLNKDSSIKGAASFVTLSGVASIQNIKIENGFLYNESADAPTEYLYIAEGSTEAIQFGTEGALATLEVLDTFDVPETPEVDPNPDPEPEIPDDPEPDDPDPDNPTPDPEPGEPDETVKPGEVGYYEAPEGAWTPATNYNGIKYGVWASEEDFLAGKAPVKWSKDAALDSSLIGSTDANGSGYADSNFIPGYVHLFANVTSPESKAQFIVGQIQKLTINLAGYTFDDTYGFRIGGVSGSVPNSSLTLKNGVWNYISGQIQARGDSQFTVDNIQFNVTKNEVFYAAQGDVILFKNSKIVAQGDMYFFLCGSNSSKGEPRSLLKFVNTDIVLNTPVSRLFEIKAYTVGSPWITAWDIYFDQNSSIVGEYQELVRITDAVDASGKLWKTGVQNLYVELGFPNQELLTTKAAYYTFDASGNALPVKMLTPSDAKDSIYNTISVDPDDVPDEPFVPEIPVTNKGQYVAPEGAWVPDEDHYGIAYGLWKSEADYLAGKAPEAWTENVDLVGSLIGASNSDGNQYSNPSFIPGYMHVFTDITNHAAQVVTGQEQKLTINLAGHTLDDRKSFRVGGSSSSHPQASLTIKNGTWKYLSGQIQLRYDTEFIVENVIFDVHNSQIFYSAAADTIIFRDCQIIARTNTHFLLCANYAKFNKPNSTLLFENTDIILLNNLTRLFEIATSNYGQTEWDIVFDENSSIIGTYTDFIQLKEKYLDGVLYTLPRQDVYIELGFSCTHPELLKSSTPFYTYDEKGNEIPVHDVQSSSGDDSKYFISYVEPDTTAPVTDKLYAIYDGEINSINNSIDGLDIAYLVNSSASEITTVIPANRDENNVAKISNEELRALAKNASVTFMTDLVYDPTGSTYEDGRISGLKAGITFDLAGFGFTLGNTYVLRKSVTLMNGKLLFKNMTATPFTGGSSGEVYTFENVEISFADSDEGKAVFEYTDGSVAIKGGSIAAENKTVFDLANGKEHSISIDGAAVNCASLVNKAYNAGTNLSLSVKNSSVTASGNVIAITGTYTEATGDRVSVTLENSSIVGKLIAADGITASLITLTVSDTYFSSLPEIPEGAGNIVMPKGQKLMTVEGGEYPFAIKEMTVGIKANLTLESVFGVQFFIPADTAITSITINGTQYKVSELTKTVVYGGVTYLVVAVEDILPSDAAEVIDIVIVYTEDEMSNTVVTGYSPIDYIKAVVSSDMSYYIKNMLVAATEYIDSAYDYNLKSSAELDALVNSADYLRVKASLTDAPVADDDTDMSMLAGALKSANLDLGATMKIRFNLNEGFTGALTVGGKNYEIIDGKCGELTYVSVELAAYEMYDCVIEVTENGNTGTYSLEKYVFNTLNNAGVGELDKALVKAFYNYTMYANLYYGVMNG